MNRFLLLLCLAVLLLPVHAEEVSLGLLELGEKIRGEEVEEVGTEYSMDYRTGRYHIIHADVVGMDCTSCHLGRHYQPDYLLMGKGEPFPKKAKGQYDRTGCLGCHRQGAEGTAFYGNVSTE